MESSTSSPEASLYKLIQSYTNKPKTGSLTVEELKTSLKAVSEEKRYSIVKSTFRGGKTILQRVMIRGHTELLNCLLSNVTTDTGQSLLMMQDKEGKTLLHQASESGSVAAIKCILDCTIPENRQELLMMHDNEGTTSLHYASQSSTADTVKLILDCTTPENRQELLMMKDNKGKTSLHYASQSSTADTVKLILDCTTPENRQELLMMKDNKGKTSLYYASKFGSVDTIKCVLDYTTPENRQELLMMKDNQKETALHYASRFRIADKVKCILDYTTPKNRQDLLMMKGNEGKTSLHHASQSRTADTVKFILDYTTPENRQELLMIKDNEGQTSLHHASQSRTANKVKCILDYTTPENRQELLMMQDIEGTTSLHYASQFSSADTGKCILDYTTPENRQELLMMKDNEGKTSLHHVSRFGTADKAKCILDYTSPENRQELLMMQDNEGTTSLHYASQFSSADTVKCILDYTIPENRQELLMMKDNEGKTSLHCATSERSCVTADAVKCILDYATSENRQELLMMKDNEGRTSLHHAASQRYQLARTLNYLLQDLTPNQQKQLIDIRDKKGETALELAHSMGRAHSGTVRILREYQNSTSEVTHGRQSADVPQESSETTSQSTNNSLLDLDLMTDSSQHLPLVPDVSAVHQLEQNQQHMQVESGGWPPSNSKVLVFPKSQTNISNQQTENTTQASSTSASFVENQTDRTFRSFPGTDFTTTTPYTKQSLLPMLYPQNPPHNPSTNWAVNSFVPSSGSTFQTLSGQNPPMSFDPRYPPINRDRTIDPVTIQPHSINTTELLSFGTDSILSTSGYIPPPVSTNLQTPFLSNHQIPRRTDISGVEGRTAGAPIDCSNQQTSGATPPQVNRYETRIEGDIIKLICNGERCFLMFPSNGTVGDFTNDVLQTTGCDCIIRSTDGYKSGNSVILKSLPIPFIISVGHTETIVTSRPEQSHVPAASASKGTESEAAAQNTAIRFGRMSNADEVVELFTFVHEQVINGKSVNAALKMARKDRKTIDRFRDIYCLHVTNKDRLNELSRDWDRSRRKGALPGLAEMARSEVDWRLLEELVGQGKATLFGGIEKG